MNAKRQINGTKYSIIELVDQALVAADSRSLDLEKAKNSLRLMGNTNPAEELVQRYARESAILDILGKMTGANFPGQIGKVDLSSRDSAITGVDKYLSRRVAGQHARWSSSHRKY